MKKIKAWSKRYLPAEAISVVTTLTAGLLAQTFVPLPVMIAYAATIGDNIGYYGYHVIRELRENHQHYQGITGLAKHLKVILRAHRNLLLEFGPAEFLDSLAVRPFILYSYTAHIPNLALALILGKITADALFYLTTISSYELKRKYLK